MNVDKVKWMAAIPYFFILLIIINGDISGNYHINVFGVRLSLFTLIPYIIYHFINKNNSIDFIAIHTKNAMILFIKYFTVMIILSITMFIFGFSIIALDPMLIFTSGFIGIVLILPMFCIVIYTIVVSIVNIIRSFKFILPDKTQWQST